MHDEPEGAPKATWLTGNRFSGSASRDSIAGWINGLGLDLTEE